MLTPEERRERHNSRQAKYRAANREKLRLRTKTWRETNPGYNRKKSAAWRLQHPTYNKEYMASYRKLFPEKVKASGAAWRAANKEYAISEGKRWRAEHPEAVRSYYRVYKQTHPEQARRATGKRLEWLSGAVIGTREWRDRIAEFNGRCAYCHTKPPRVQMDHVKPLSRGGKHEIGNVVPCCKSCNLRKGSKTLLEFVAYLQRVAA